MPWRADLRLRTQPGAAVAVPGAVAVAVAVAAGAGAEWALATAPRRPSNSVIVSGRVCMGRGALTRVLVCMTVWSSRVCGAGVTLSSSTSAMEASEASPSPHREGEERGEDGVDDDAKRWEYDLDVAYLWNMYGNDSGAMPVPVWMQTYEN